MYSDGLLKLPIFTIQKNFKILLTVYSLSPPFICWLAFTNLFIRYHSTTQFSTANRLFSSKQQRVLRLTGWVPAFIIELPIQAGPPKNRIVGVMK